MASKTPPPFKVPLSFQLRSPAGFSALSPLMKSSHIHPLIRVAILLSIAALSSLVSAQVFPEVAPEIVSAWKANAADAVVVFNYDGSYHHIQGGTADPAMERGSFTWNKETQAFTTQPHIDTSGTAGRSEERRVGKEKPAVLLVSM